MRGREGNCLSGNEKVLRMDGGRTLGGFEEMESHHKNSSLEHEQQNLSAVFFNYAIDSCHRFSNSCQFSGQCILRGSGNHRTAARWHHLATGRGRIAHPGGFRRGCARRLFQVPRFLSTNFYRPSCASPSCHVLHGKGISSGDRSFHRRTAGHRRPRDRRRIVCRQCRASFAVRGAGQQNARIC